MNQMVDPTDGKPGLRIETAAAVMANEMMAAHLAQFRFVIMRDRLTSSQVVAAYIEGLSAVMALTIAGRHGSRDDVLNASTVRLREETDKVLKHLKAR